MKIGPKMGLGFGAITGVTAILGITAYVMFRNVDLEVDDLSTHSLPVVQHSTGVERSAYECILQEKNYVIKPAEETHALARKNVGELQASLSKIDEIAARYGDTALADQSKEVRKVAGQWIGLYDQGVEAIKGSKAAEKTMMELGETVAQKANDYIEAKNLEYSVSTGALAAVNRILTAAYGTRMYEKEYRVEPTDEHLKGLQAQMRAIRESLRELGDSNPDEAEAKQISAAQSSLGEYETAFVAWKDLHAQVLTRHEGVEISNASASQGLDQRIASLSEVMDKAGDKLINVADQYQKTKAKRTELIADSVFMVSDIAQLVPTARLTSRRYMMTQDPTVFLQLMNQLKSLQKLYADLRKLATSQFDRTCIDEAAKATQDYEGACRLWATKDDELRKKILPEMSRIGSQVLKTAQAAEIDAWKDSSASSDKVVSIVGSSKTISIVSMIIGCALGIMIAMAITRSIVPPLRQGVEFSGKIAAGDLRQTLSIRRDDEIGQLALSMNAMAEGLKANMGAIASNAQSLNLASERLGAVSTQVSSAAEETANQAGVVSAAAEQVSRNVGTVATSAEEMNASIREISKNATEAAKVAEHAAEVAERTNITVSKLGDSSVEIGNVIKVITSIAEQTNLLALNATIEAARAGEAGKGFAVVAGEVKELAKQTAKATDEIGSKIKTIQQDTVGAVDAIREISSIIAQINQLQAIIATAVEEQAATTNEISKNVNEAATGVGEIAKNIGTVSVAAKGTTEGAGQTAAAAQELARLASSLQAVVDKFSL